MSPHDHTLKPLMGTLGATLQRINTALEAYADTDQVAELEPVIACIDQVRAAFTTLEQPDATVLAEEMLSTTRSLAQNQLDDPIPAREALLQAALQLPRYLEWLRRAGEKPLFNLLPLSNQLRTSRGLAPIGQESATADSPSWLTLKQTAMRLRPILQRLLIGVLRGRDVAGSLEKIAGLFGDLQQIAPDTTAYRFWWLAQALTLEWGAAPSPNAKLNLLLRDLDLHLKHLTVTDISSYQDATIQALAQRLEEQLLESEGGQIRLQQHIDYHPPHTVTPPHAITPSQTASGLTLVDVETTEQVAEILKESMAHIKGVIDHFARDDEHHADILQGIPEKLHELANVLTLLNIDVCADLSTRHANTVQLWQDKGKASDEAIFEFASELMLVEGSLEDIGDLVISRQLAATTVHDLSTADRLKLLLELEYKRAGIAVSQEILSSIEQSWALLNAHRNSEQPFPWNTLEDCLAGTSGAFAMLGFNERMVKMVERLEQGVQMLSAGAEVNNQSLLIDTFIHTLTVPEQTLTSLKTSKTVDDTLLDQAEEHLRMLETLFERRPALITEAPTPAFTPTPTAATPLELELRALDLESSEPPIVIPESPTEAPPATAEVVTEAVTPASDIDPEFIEIFFEEAQGELSTIGEQLGLWRKDPNNADALTAIRRSFHTLKGSGRMVGETAIADFAWGFEQLLNRIIDKQLEASSEIFQAIDDAQAALEPIVREINPQGSHKTAILEALTQRAEALSRGEIPASVKAVEAALEPMEPTETLDALGDLEDLENLEPVEPAKPVEAMKPAEPIAIEEFVSTIPTGPSVMETAPSMDVDPELVEAFLYEAVETLDANDDIMQRWKTEQGNIALLNDLRRGMHTLKGGARMTGFMSIGDLAHAMESLLDAIATGEVAASNKALDTLQRALDNLNDMVLQGQGGTRIAPAEELTNTLNALLSGEVQAPTPISTPEEIPVEPAPAPQEPFIHVDEIPESELDPELIAIFRTELNQILDTSRTILELLHKDPENHELLIEFRREMHTLKGSSRTAGYMVIADLAYPIESLLNTIAKHGMSLSAKMLDTLQRALDSLDTMLTQLQDGVKITPATELINVLNELMIVPAPAQAAGPTTVTVEQKPSVPVLQTSTSSEDTIRVSSNLLNNLVNQMGESSIYRARVNQGVGTLQFSLSEMDQTVGRLRQQLRRLEIETETQILFRYEEGPQTFHGDFDPLELDRFSELQQLSRSLMEIVDDLSNIQNTLEDQSQEMGFLLDQQAKVNKELQQGLMQTRMVRFSSIVPRLRRVVRQVAKELGKQAELVLEGAESEIDRTVLEHMVPPLEHLLRNSLSHGIESPEQRTAAGKPEIGIINLALRREGAELVLTLNDDGAGLNFDAIRAKGEANGMLKPGQAVTEQELINLLVRPGFSTATQVTQIAGRGVGMDVVNDAIKVLRGALQIRSEAGKGAHFIIRLPFSLAVTQALLVETAGEIYAIPLLSIEAVDRLKEDELKTYLSGETVQHRYGEHAYPLHSLSIVFGNQGINYEEIADTYPPALLFRSAEASAALQVDAVLGNQEIIVKPVGPQLHAVPGISGATMLGDGRVIVVLELAALVRNLASQTKQQVEARILHSARQKTRSDDGLINAMVIDDSITMRKVTTHVLKRHNIDVSVAKDGVEAVALLEDQSPDLVILDIEMPRMDGFEVLAHIRNQAHLKNAIVIMVTSRSGEKHRDRANRLGVDDYLIKPYQEEEIMKSIRKHLHDRGLQLTA